MQIGSSFPLIPAPSRSRGGVAADPRLQQRPAESTPPPSQQPSPPQPSPPQPPSSEPLQASVPPRQAAQQNGFYSMDRQLSLTGREALAAYQTNAQFNVQPETEQLVGVDIYV